MEFKKYSLDQLLIHIVDNRGRTCPTSEQGIPLIATNCIKQDSLFPVFEKIRYISQDTYNNWFRSHPKPNDIIFVCKGSPGRVAWTPEIVNFCIAQDMVALRANPQIIDPKYLFALLRSDEVQQKISNMHVGTLIPHFKKGDFKNLHLDIITDLTIQKEIGNKYFQLLEKIEINTQINQTLEQIAQALFKSWFVDFDPVCAKVQALSDGLSLEQAELAAMQAISGKTPEELTALSQTQPDRYAELSETAKAFPCEMVEVDGVKVPKGWECFSLKELSSVVSKGTTPKKSSLSSCDSKETVPFIKVKDISESGQILINQVEQIPEKISSTELKRSILHKNDILISIAGTIGRVAIVPNELENANTNQAISFIRLYNDNLVGIISTFLKSRKNQKDILSKVIQGVQANISLEVVRNIKIFLPINFDHKAILIFNSLLNKQLINQKENLLTEKSRDLLLPQLLSGEIDEK